jgi:hypothetical protein
VCPDHLQQPNSRDFYVENLGVYFETKILLSGGQRLEAVVSATTTAVKLRSSVASGIANVDSSSNILDLPGNSKLTGNGFAISRLLEGAIDKRPITIERLTVSLHARDMKPFRVIPGGLAESDEVDRFKVEPKKFLLSKDEQLRRLNSQCLGDVFSKFEKASREVTKIAELKLGGSWASVPQVLAQAKRLPADPKDAEYATIKKFEIAYRDLIERCTTRNLSQSASKAIGKLTIGADACTAVRLGRKYIATSRHCLFDDWGRAKPVSPLDIKFSYSALRNPVPVCGIVRSHSGKYDFVSKEITSSNDYIILAIQEQDYPAGVVIMDSSKARGGIDSPTELEVTGVWPGSSVLGLAGRDDLLTYTGAYCLVVGPKAPKAAGCILHKCGTIAGGSGSPLMRRASISGMEEGFEVLALNRGEAELYGTGAECTELPNGVEANNVGTILPKEILNELN